MSDSVNAGKSVASFSQRLHVKISFTVLIFSLDFAITVIIIFITIIITSDAIIIIIIMITDTCYSFFTFTRVSPDATIVKFFVFQRLAL